MKITWLKRKDDRDSFRMAENLGFDVCKIEDLENTDNTLKELVNQKYTTIIMTNEVARIFGKYYKKI